MQRIRINHGRCGRCGRELTNEDSMARGYGPKCWRLVHYDNEQDVPRSILGSSQAQEAMSEISRRILRAVGDEKCSCGERLDAGAVDSYDHAGGIKLKGYGEAQWVHLRCKCGHQVPWHRVAGLEYEDLELSWKSSPHRALALTS
jgi:hypothetical protein